MPVRQILLYNRMMEKENNQNTLMTFGEHLEVFRKMLFRILVVAMILAIVIFCAKKYVFFISD